MSDSRQFDDALEGFYSKPDKGGRVRWYGRAWVPSEHRRRYWALGTSEARARTLWHAVLADVEKAAARQVAERRARREGSLGALVKAFLGSYRSRGGTAYYKSVLKAPEAALGPMSPAKIDAAVLDRYLNDRRILARNDGSRKIGESTLRKECVALGTVFRWAKRRGLVQVNPLADYEKPEEPDEQGIAVLSPDQEKAVLALLPPLERDVAEWALYSGMRRGEILALSWRNVDGARGVVHVPGAKTGKARTVPLSLSERLPAVLGRHPQRIGCPLVFHEQDGSPLDVDRVNGALAAAMKSAGVSKPRGALWNMLRKTWVSRLYASGRALPQDEADIAGHSMAVAVRHYRALSAEHHERLAGALDPPRRGARGGARKPSGRKVASAKRYAGTSPGF